jgi:hypothetical protein
LEGGAAVRMAEGEAGSVRITFLASSHSTVLSFGKLVRLASAHSAAFLLPPSFPLSIRLMLKQTTQEALPCDGQRSALLCCSSRLGGSHPPKLEEATQGRRWGRGGDHGNGSGAAVPDELEDEVSVGDGCEEGEQGREGRM